ncbi:hypothetical protein PHLCEN_2v5008 [Hermanssonia centrifuga]|uniref:NAD-dependent epimerase/dehydratase domain-containing protein n=1 Tax=Hermanssonia centrifuga TaxID=98765 RepID=A0A2R6PC41_9APHY|nr:hypothetical protein PHLCEN_2v5008 [Hermanssonia centrifuga]
MKVLIIGASGFIGLPVARALSRAGHIVYGLTRSESKAKALAAEEIIPIVGEPSNPEKWVSLVNTLDVVIEAVAGADLKTQSSGIFQAVVHAAQTLRPSHAPKLAYIYTSGTWVHGDDRETIITDTTPITKPVELVAWRPALEQEIVTSTVVNGIVIRPSMLYGYSGSILSMMFKRAHEGKVSWFGTPGGRLAFVHADDLADLYLRAAEKAQLVRGQIFDGTNDFTESADELLEKLVQVSGAQGPYEYVQASNLFETAITATALIRPYLGRALLGWQPRKAGVIDNLEVYYNAWKASL